MTERPRIYLAGEMDGDWRQRVKGICAGMAISWVEPLSWEEILRRHGDEFHDTHYGPIDHPRIFQAATGQRNPVPEDDLARLDSSDLVLAYLDGPERYGTICEIGYAHGKGKEVWTVARRCLFPEQDVQTSLSDDEIDRYLNEDEYVPWRGHPFPPEETCYWFAEALCRHDDIGIPEYLCSLLRERFKEALDSKRQMCESPIETAFYDAATARLLHLEPQHKIGPYRADFAIPSYKVVIELDGHDYHKTKEQRTNDAKRARYLQSDGWTVVRFTGTEVHHGVQGCVQDVFRILSSLGGTA